jgi:nucleotide-binding universal stress UspA family protein
MTQGQVEEAAMRVVLSADLTSESRAARGWCVENLAPGTAVVAVLGVSQMGELMLGVPPFDLGAAEHELRASVERDYCEPLDAAGLQCEGRVLALSQGRALTEVAHDEHADLIVVGKRPHGWLVDVVRGELAGQLVHHPPCPVVVVPTAPVERAGARAAEGSGGSAAGWAGSAGS